MPWNRKYLGSKRLLRDWIAQQIVQRVGVPSEFLDGFCGTGSIGVTLALRGAGRVVAVDSLESNCIILQGFVETGYRPAADERVASLLRELNALSPFPGYITESYAGTYFTTENCQIMDSVREHIGSMRVEGKISDAEHSILLASFLLAADRVANTIGQYDAFLKHIDSKARQRGRHLVDDRVKSRFFLQPLARLEGLALDVVHGDMLSLASGMNADIAYFDPPYNGRQYCDNYHVLENLACWKKPALHGKTRKFDRTGMKSAFSMQGADGALEKLIRETTAREIFLSYSSEGLLSREEIHRILARHGRVK
ncbi:MAG TPA: DNA adenine methylase, partial [Spirochaetia bacterium]|nr:DNA adenine methylase [Spirochaetia bacterium]